MVGRRRRDARRQRVVVQRRAAGPHEGDRRKECLHRLRPGAIAWAVRCRRGIAARDRHSGEERRLPGVARGVGQGARALMCELRITPAANPPHGLTAKEGPMLGW